MTSPIDRIANDPNIDPAFRRALTLADAETLETQRIAAAFGLLRAAVMLAVSVGPEHTEEAMGCLRRALEESEKRDG
jgi:hypothetical protein